MSGTVATGQESSSLNKQLLRKYIPFESLTDTNLDDLIAKSTVENLPKDRIIFKREEDSKHCIYLLEGQVDLCDANFNIKSIKPGEPGFRTALDNTNPHKQSAISKSAVTLLKIDRDYLDLVVTWNQAGNYLVTDLIENEEEPAPQLESEGDWMAGLLRSHLFERIPPANIQQLFSRFEEVKVQAGERIITQGEKGDCFYVIKQGEATVERKINQENQVLANLSAGDFFGQDALIGDAPRNASISMKTDGQLMRLGQDDFKKLLQEPVLDYVQLDEAKDMLIRENPATILVDVRLEDEFNHGHLPGAMNLPLSTIRQRIDMLDEENNYITVCDGGRRCELGAYLLSQAGLNAYVLKDVGEAKDALVH